MPPQLTIPLIICSQALVSPAWTSLRNMKVQRPIYAHLSRLSLTTSGFRQSLQHAESAPELVFERLIGNVKFPSVILLTVYILD